MKLAMKRFVDKYLNRTLDFRVRLFNVLAMAGTLISFLMAVLGVINDAGPLNVAAALVSTGLSYALLTYSLRTGKYQLCYTITIVSIFMVLFPILFFSSGGYLGGMPCFFVFAVAFTVFMLEGRRAVVLSLLETAIYVAACLVAWFYPQTVVWFDGNGAVLIDVVVAFVTVSAALGVSLFLHFRLYNEQQKKLAQQNAILEEINRQKTEFLSNISHELKTPLTVVSSHVQLGLENLEDTDESRRTMKLIGGEVDRMALMVTQVLDVGRIDEGRMTIEPKQESVVEIIQTTMDNYYPVFTKNRNRLSFRLEGSVPAVLCDRMRTTQVLVNLIGNAVRHTRGGEITVAAKVEDGFAVVTVADTGEGIEAERIPHLFERYSSHRPAQSSKARTGQDTGTGLGLFICQYIVEAHKGRIWIESTLGAGTTASFTLPLADAFTPPPGS